MTGNPSSSEMFGQLLGGAWITQGIYVAAELGIADHLIERSRSVNELAAVTGCHEESLYRLLRALAGIGLFVEDADGNFSLTPLAEPLCSDRPDSQRALAIMMGAELYGAWGELHHSVRTGGGGFRKAYGKGFFEYMTGNPERHRIYDAAMHGIHGVESHPVLTAYDFSCFDRVVDVGGGNGGMLAAILKHHPNLNGILFDLPAVVDRARTGIETRQVSGRCQFEGGDFFSAVPGGADCYLLRHILHDWCDDQALKILGNCRKAMRPGGKILIIENLIPKGNEPHFGKWLDLMMLLVEGKERTEEQYDRLISAAGLLLEKVVPTTAGVSVLVAA